MIGERRLARLHELARGSRPRYDRRRAVQRHRGVALATDARDLPFTLIVPLRRRRTAAPAGLRERASIRAHPAVRLDERRRRCRSAAAAVTRRSRSAGRVSLPAPALSTGRRGSGTRPPTQRCVVPIAPAGPGAHRPASSSPALNPYRRVRRHVPELRRSLRRPDRRRTRERARVRRASAAGPRRWPSSIARRRRSSATSATSSARR